MIIKVTKENGSFKGMGAVTSTVIEDNNGNFLLSVLENINNPEKITIMISKKDREKIEIGS